MQTRDCLNRILVYKPGKPTSELKRELGLTDVIKLASNENPLGASPKALEAMTKAAAEVSVYPDGSGYYLAGKIASLNRLTMENVLLGNGSDEIIRLLTLSYVNPGDEVISGNLAFITYRIATDLADGKNIFVPFTDELRTDLEETLEAITPRTRLIFIDNPNNPTGTIVTRDEVARFIERVPSNVIVVFDEAYFEYIDDDEYPDSLDFLRQGHTNIVILRTFSKIYGLAGLRIGYALAAKNIIEQLNKVRCPFNTSSFAQTAALASLDDPLQITRSRALVTAGKDFFYRELPRLGVRVIPSYSNFILAKFPCSGRELFEKLLKKGIIIRPLTGYGLDNFLRISIGRVDENEKLVEVLENILEINCPEGALL